jgi:general secretion pathway protein F
MPVYTYEALTNTGQLKKGSINADTEKQARALLRAQKLIPSVLTKLQTKANKSKQQTSQAGKLSHAELVLFTRQLATLLSSGMQLNQALSGVIEQTDKPKTKQVLMSIRTRIVEGHTLAFGLSEFPKSFSQMYVATVKAGEESGHLDKVLVNLADYTENQQTVSAKIKQAAIYPILMVVLSFAIVAFLLAYVVPQLVTLFADSNQTLPYITILVIAASNLVKSYGLYTIFAVFLISLAWQQALKNKKFRLRVHTLYLSIPVIGKIVKNLHTARFARTFGILLSAGLPVLEAMQAASEVVTNIYMQNLLIAAKSKVKEGNDIHTALKQTKLFMPMALHLMASGQASGQLAPMLLKSADNQEHELEMFINSTVSLFEPVMTVVMGGVILVIVLAVLLPIFALSQMVNV